MNSLIIFWITIILFFVIIPLIIFLIFRVKILSFLHPEKYCIIEMMERDNNVISWIEKKDKDLQFTFNEGIYNMFDVVAEQPENIKVNGEEIPNPPQIFKRVFSNIYRDGRLAKLYYKEGESNPLDFRNLKIHNDAQQSNQIEKIQISRLIHSNVSLGSELWNKYGIFLIIGIIMLLLYLVFKGSGGTPPTTPTG